MPSGNKRGRRGLNARSAFFPDCCALSSHHVDPDATHEIASDDRAEGSRMRSTRPILSWKPGQLIPSLGKFLSKRVSATCRGAVFALLFHQLRPSARQSLIPNAARHPESFSATRFSRHNCIRAPLMTGCSK